MSIIWFLKLVFFKKVNLTVVRQSSDTCQAVFRHSSGSCLVVLGQLSDSRQAVLRQLFDNCQAVVMQMSNCHKSVRFVIYKNESLLKPFQS